MRHLDDMLVQIVNRFNLSPVEGAVIRRTFDSARKDFEDTFPNPTPNPRNPTRDEIFRKLYDESCKFYQLGAAVNAAYNLGWSRK